MPFGIMNLNNYTDPIITEHIVNLQYPTFSLSWFCRASAAFTPLSLSLVRLLCTRSNSTPKPASSASFWDTVSKSSAFSASKADSWVLSCSLDYRKRETTVQWEPSVITWITRSNVTITERTRNGVVIVRTSEAEVRANTFWRTNIRHPCSTL